MLRITPWRVIKLIAYLWSGVIFSWVFLPSPTIGHPEVYIQNALAQGDTVITAFEYDPLKFQPESRTNYPPYCTECTSLLPHWRLVPVGRDTLLRASYSNGYGAVNITGILRDAKQWNLRQPFFTGREWTAYLSDEITLDGMPGGSVDEEVNIPWFTFVDQNLFHYNMHNFETTIPVRALVPRANEIEIWRVVPTIKNVPWSQESSPTTHDASHAFTSSKIDPGELLAVFELWESLDYNDRIITKFLTGSLPSRTYPIRRTLLVFLGPFTVLVIYPMAISLWVSDNIIAPIFPFHVFWISCIVGLVVYRRMALIMDIGPQSSGIWDLANQICQRLWVLAVTPRQRSDRVRRVWGPTGPVKVWDELDDEEKGVELQRPQTVRLGRGYRDSAFRKLAT